MVDPGENIGLSRAEKMAVADVKAFFDILSSLGAIVVNTGIAYYRASGDIEAFRLKAEDLKSKMTEWNRLLVAYDLPQQDPVLVMLNRARNMLEAEEERLKKFQEGNCCFRFSKKATFPIWMITDLDRVSRAFDGIAQNMREKLETADLRTKVANTTLAPFSFVKDEKYVPIMETVTAIESALDSDTPTGTVVLLHGESGRGKSTVAKYLALKFQEEFEAKQETSKFPGGIFFLACQKSINTVLLIEKLWRDLGFGSNESFPMDTSPDYEQLQTERLENLRRKLMTELKVRRSTLIIIDNVWEEDVISDLRIPYKHVKYLVTSQKSYLCLDATARVSLTKPSVEEARQILQRHSGTWTDDKPLDPQLETQIDELIKEVDFSPLVLANLGTIVKNKSLASYSDLTAETVETMRQDLKALLKHIEDHVEVEAFWEIYKQTIYASMTLALDVFFEEARTIVYLMVMCKDLTVDEVILEALFCQVFGQLPSGEVKLLYSSALGQLKAESIIVSESRNDESGDQMPWTTWSIHELRRQFIRERRKEDLAKIWKKLMTRHSEQNDDELQLVAALCRIYGDKACCDKIELQSKLQASKERLWRRESIKSFVVLLHPTAKDGWRKNAHELAKQVILHSIKYDVLPDEAISRLLQLPEASLATCSAIQGSYCTFYDPSPKTTNFFAAKISTYLHSDMTSNISLSMYLGALCRLSGSETLRIVPDLPETLFSLLQQTHDGKLSTSLLRALLWSISNSWESDSYTNNRRIASIPDLLETLVKFLDKDKYPDKFELSAKILGKLAFVLGDENSRTSFAAIPNALQSLMDLLPFSGNAADTLRSLAEVTFIAERIASTSATLNSLLHFLADGNNVDLVNKALCVLNELLWTRPSRKLICARPKALMLLVDLVSKDTSKESFELVQKAIIRITMSIEEMPDETFGPFLEAALRKYMELLANGVDPAFQLGAVEALTELASPQVIGKSVMQSCPEVGEQLLRLMQEDAHATPKSFGKLTAAFHAIVIKRAKLGDSKLCLTLISEAIRQYARLLEVEELQEIAAQALSNIAWKLETCKLRDSSLVQKLVVLVREGTKPSTVKFVTHAMQNILVRENVARNGEKSLLSSGALKRYFELLEDGVEQDLKSESARALGIFTSLAINRNLTVAYPSALQKLSGLIRIRNEIPSVQVLRNVASAVESITVRGTHLEDVVGSFFSTALEMYDSLLRDEVDEEVQEEAIRALGKLAFNEATSKLFCSFPTAIQRLVGRLKRNFIGKSYTLRDLAVTINKLLLCGKALGETERTRIMSEIVERYIELLGDGVERRVQVESLKALRALCKKDDARRLVLTLPGALDRIVGLLNADVHNALRDDRWPRPALRNMVVEVARFVIVLTVGGTDLAEKATITLVLDIIECFIRLLIQVDDEIFRVHLLYALALLSGFPTIRTVIRSYPQVQIQLEKILKDDLTPPLVFVAAAGTVWIIHFQGPDMDRRITARFVSSALKSYIALQSYEYGIDVHSGQSYGQVAATILDNLMCEAATVDNHVTVDSIMAVARRLVRLLATHPREIYSYVDWIPGCLNLISDIDAYVAGDCCGRSKQEVVELRSKAFNYYVALFERMRSTSKYLHSDVCKAIADHIDQASDRTLLTAECPDIAAKLLATFDSYEDYSIKADIEGYPSGFHTLGFHMASNGMGKIASNAERVVFETMRTFTLMDPSGSDQIVLSSSEAFRGRGQAKVSMKMYESALLDYDRALELRPNSAPLLCEQAYIRAQLSDLAGASTDLHEAVNLYPDNWYYRTELGILKQVMGNLHDALADLDLAAVLNSSCVYFYILKQRGYVKFLLGDEGGARADAEKAVLCRPVWDHVAVYNLQRNFVSSAVKYLEFSM